MSKESKETKTPKEHKGTKVSRKRINFDMPEDSWDDLSLLGSVQKPALSPGQMARQVVIDKSAEGKILREKLNGKCNGTPKKANK